MTTPVLLVADVPVPAFGADAIRIRHRAGLLARRGGGVLFAPPSPTGPLMIPGIRHLDPHCAPGSDPEHLETQVADLLGPLIDQLKPQVVHAFGMRAAVPAVLRRRHGVRVIIEPGRTPAHRLRDSQPEIPPSRLEDLVDLEDKTLAHADAVIARSALEAAILVRRGVKSERIWTVPDGLPVPGDIASPLPDLPQVVAVMGHAPDEAATVVLRAMTRVQRAWRLVMIGPADWSTGATEHRARALHLDHRVAYARLDEDTELRVAAAQVVVCGLPSGRAVQAGAVVPEAALWAMACRRPLVAPDLPAMRAYAGAAARYYDPEDPGKLALALDALLGDPALRDALATRAEAQRTALSWDGADATVSDIWAALLAAPPVT